MSAAGDGDEHAAVGGEGDADDDGGATRGRWTAEEDALVRDLVAIHGASSWSAIALRVDGRTGKQCRERCALSFVSLRALVALHLLCLFCLF